GRPTLSPPPRHLHQVQTDASGAVPALPSRVNKGPQDSLSEIGHLPGHGGDGLEASPVAVTGSKRPLFAMTRETRLRMTCTAISERRSACPELRAENCRSAKSGAGFSSKLQLPVSSQARGQFQ